MVKPPRFKSSFSVRVLSADKVLLSGKMGEEIYLHGRGYAYLAPYLYKNEQSVDELIDCLQDKCSPQTIYYALLRLEEKGYLEDPAPPAVLPKRAIDLSAPFQLQSHKKVFVKDGGHRICSPEKTFETYSHLIHPKKGVIDRLIPTISNETTCTPGYIAFGYRGNQNNLQVLSGGKGKTDAQAKASCLCEALERYSTAFHGDEPMKQASYRFLKDALHPHHLLNFSEKQYQTRKLWNRNCHDFHWIPVPFEEEKETHWTPIWSFTENKYKWIPTAYCYFNYPADEPFCVADSNGCAAGNTKEEAILQGFFELVERDCIALWWYPRARRPAVDLSSFPDPYIAHLQAHYTSHGRELWAIDLTDDLNIPAFAAISRLKGEKEEIVFGFGAHFDPQIALLRALTEANQSLDCTSFLKQDKIGAHFHLRKQWLLNSRLEDHLHFAPHPSLPAKKMSDYQRFDTDDLKTDILACEKIVAAKGMELLVLDKTRPEIGLPVVRVVVPGLRHMWNRYAPGRLYDTPLQLGWIHEALREEELNPLPVFI